MRRSCSLLLALLGLAVAGPAQAVEPSGVHCGLPDTDGDGWGDICDDCPQVPDPGQSDNDPTCNCCSGGDPKGCSGDDQCEAIVCSYDPACCEVEWDSICDGEAIRDCICCFTGDGVGDACDNCPGTYNPGGIPVLFRQTVVALSAEAGFTWPSFADYAYVWGTFTTSADIGTWEYSYFGTATGTVLHEATLPAPRSGLWYLLRPSCHAGSWSTGGPGELPGRDDALP